MNLALANFALTLTPDGEVQIGGVTMPCHAARDLAARLWELAGDAPADVQGRLRCRAHLDRDFANAGKVRCWPTGSKAAGANLPAVREGSRLVVRLSDSSIAVLLNHGSAYWTGFRMQLRDDSLAGPVAELAMPMERFSCRGVQALQIQEKG
jgi:hypothetical protein